MLTIALIVISVALFLFFVVLGPPSISSKSIEDHLKEFSSSGEDSIMDENSSRGKSFSNSTNSFLIIGSDEDQRLDRESAFQCGWVYVTADYECPPKVNVSKFSSTASKASRPPRSVFFCVLKDQSLYLYEGEAQVRKKSFDFLS